MKMAETKFDSTYSAVVSMAEQLVGEGKYDSTYSAVLAIYQNLTSDVDTKFDSVYSIVVTIADGIEDGSISLGGEEPVLGTLTKTIRYNGDYHYIPTGSDGFSSVDITVNVQGSGGGDSDENGPRNTHQFYDYLGNLVEEWTLEETQEKTELPTAPGFTLPDGTVINHDGWNWSLERLKEIGTPQNVGSFYRPSDDKPRFVVDIPQDHLTLYLYISQNVTIDIDWGDGTVSSHEYGSGYPTHTYSSPGTYVIKCSNNKWKFSFVTTNTPKLLDYKTIKGIINYNYGGSNTPTGAWARSEPLMLGGLTNLDYITFNDYNGVIGGINSSDNYIYKVSNRCLCLPRQLKLNPVSGYDNYIGSLCEIICYPDDWEYSVKVKNYSRIKTITFPKTYTSINNVAFQNCSSLTSITIPNSVTSIGASAFQSCTGLTSIEIPDSITSIGETAFQYCSGLKSVIIGNSVNSIGENAFQYCYGLESVIIGNSVTSIYSRMFENCYGLKSVIIGNSVNSIGSNAFYNCQSLTSIEIPDSVTSIGNYAFQYCYGLTSVVMGSSVTSIGEKVFDSINNLIIDFSNCLQVPSISSINAMRSSLILVPESLYDEWIATTNWSSLTSQIQAVPGK